MGCTSCGSGGCGTKPNGCRNNGGCKTGGCNKMNVFDWLSGMQYPSAASDFDIVEVRFKNGRKEFYHNSERIELYTGDAVVVEAVNGYHIGCISLQGELVRLQMKKKKVRTDQLLSIKRKASERDLQKMDQALAREHSTMYRTREVIQSMGLKMKLSDVEFQADNTKAVFYYSADERVDFRELIKVLAAEFKIRVEMRQINLRQEAGRLGGIGVCGRELCCSTWLSDFKNVSSSAAKYQNLSLNPAKLAGQCGRLKCCLNYELDTYMDALRDIPALEKPLLIGEKEAFLQKTDIFRKMMWFGHNDNNNWEAVSVERVKEIIQMNAQGERPSSLNENSVKKDSVPFIVKELREQETFRKPKPGNRSKNRSGNGSRPVVKQGRKEGRRKQ